MSTKLELLLLMQRLDRCNAAAGDGMGEGEATDEDQPSPGTGGEGDGGALAGFVFEGGAVGLAEAVAGVIDKSERAGAGGGVDGEDLGAGDAVEDPVGHCGGQAVRGVVTDVAEVGAGAGCEIDVD